MWRKVVSYVDVEKLTIYQFFSSVLTKKLYNFCFLNKRVIQSLQEIIIEVYAS